MPRPLAELDLVRDDVVVRVVPVGADPVAFGRDMTNTVVFTDDDVSAHHAIVAIGPDGLVVTDLRSTNGTWVNDVVVAGTVALADGDELRLGADVRLRVRAVDPFPVPDVVLHDLGAGTREVLSNDHLNLG